MAHSRPDNIETRGDAWRITTAAGAFVIALVTDPRVDGLYPHWWKARAEAFARLASDQVRRRLDDSLVQRALNSYLARELEATERLIKERLPKIPPAWTFWVASSIVEAFSVRSHNERHPEDQRQFAIPVRMDTKASRGRAPRNDGADITRNVKWFYRAIIQHPPDSIHQLAEEYAQDAQRHTDARSVVQNGIEQARGLLDLLSERAVRLPGA